MDCVQRSCVSSPPWERLQMGPNFYHGLPTTMLLFLRAAA